MTFTADSLSTFLSGATILQAMTFVIVLLAPRFRQPYANRILIALLLVFCIEKADQLFLASGAVLAHPQFGMIGNLFGALISPLIFLHVCARTDTGFRLNRATALVFIPFVLLVIYAVASFHVLPLEDKRAAFAQGLILTPLNTWIIPVLGDLVSLGIFLAAMRVLHRHDMRVRNWFSEIEDRTLTGLRTLVAMIAILMALHLVWTLTRSPGFGLVLNLAHFILINVLGLTALRPAPQAQGEERALPETAPGNSQADPALLQAIDAALEADKLYLDPDLTVARLARHIRHKPRAVSETINALAGRNFYDHVNRLRIDAAKLQLKAEPDTSILDIAYACGFNSKSAFNTAFKRLTLVTPSAFRRDG
jgi:AraC-like DNA-binding protein